MSEKIENLSSKIESAIIESGHKPEEWRSLCIDANEALSMCGLPADTKFMTPEIEEKLDKFFEKSSENIDYTELDSASYDPDPYGVGGSYVCSDNWSYDESEFQEAQLRYCLDLILCDGIVEYVDLDDKFYEELRSPIDKEAIEYLVKTYG